MNNQFNHRLTRREFLHRVAMLGLSASTVALLDGCGIFPAPTATPARIPRIGYLAASSLPNAPFTAFRQGLAELGYVEGKNITIEYRFADGHNELLPAFASELIAVKIDILMAAGTPPTATAKNATSTIPIVFAGVGDPIGAGLVTSFGRPGGNVTGLTNFSPTVDVKRLEILKETMPGISRVAVLLNPTNASNVSDLRSVQEAATQLGFQIHAVEVQKPEDLDSAFTLALSQNPEAIMSLDDALLQAVLRDRIIELAAKNHVPVTHRFRDNVVAGGLMSYGPNVPEQYRRAATYVDKILKGAKPADLPVEGPTKFDFAINLKTAKTLGIKFPQSILAQATEVIQ